MLIHSKTSNNCGLDCFLTSDDVSNALSIDLAFDVAEYFHVTESKAKAIHQRLLKVVSQWEVLAQQAGIRKEERELLRECFMLD